jgi:hypothetical protein
LLLVTVVMGLFHEEEKHMFLLGDQMAGMAGMAVALS